MTTLVQNMMLQITKSFSDCHSQPLLTKFETFNNDNVASADVDTAAKAATKALLDFEKEKSDITRRTTNVIVTGLTPRQGVTTPHCSQSSVKMISHSRLEWSRQGDWARTRYLSQVHWNALFQFCPNVDGCWKEFRYHTELSIEMFVLKLTLSEHKSKYPYFINKLLKTNFGEIGGRTLVMPLEICITDLLRDAPRQ